MQQNAIRSGSVIERKIISISVKRQLTIPQKYFEALGFNNEAECILQDEGLFIRPLRDTGASEFSEQILADLISQGYAGQELLEKFKEYSRAIRPAVLKLIEETEAFARSGEGCIQMNELFGAEE
jgi:bifunctional DNA-binding transcriptional regulator/antitoxin component of YhaV-PrlF toxin-antitoxin module